MTRFRAILLTVLAMVAMPARALADDAPVPEPMPTLHMRLGTGPGVLIGPNGKHYVIPQESHIVTGDVWNMREAELLRLQETETRIQAENTSLRKASKSWQPGAYVVVIAFLGGVTGGWYLNSRLF